MKIYHHNDLDGRCSAAIAWRALVSETSKPTLIEVDYKDRIDVETITPNEVIYILDFSFKPEVMEKVLEKTDKVVWIDHHKTAFSNSYNTPEMQGLRDVLYAGCELTWRWFHPDEDLPTAVALIGDYDKWALKFSPDCFQFCEGMKLEDTTPTSTIWYILFYEVEAAIELIQRQGEMAIKYRDNYCMGIRKAFGYEVEWYGHLAYATNFYQFGSKGFGDKLDEYDFCIAYIYDGNRFTVSLYSEKVDVSEICKAEGGGGHKGAAGFVCDRLPFKRLAGWR